VCAVTATRDRRSDPAEDAESAWDDRPILGTSRGLPWWGAVLLAFGLAVVAAVVDMQINGSLGKIYQGAYLLGCVAAICLVRRRSLFGPMVQPPLVFAVTAIGAVVILGDDGGDGLRQLIFSVALPLTSNFPTMAITTGLTLALGLFRLYKQRDPNPPVRVNRTERPEDTADAPPAARKERPTRNRPGKTDDEEAPPRRGNRPTRDRTERGGPDRRDRDAERPADRARGGRGRPRDQEPPARRRDPDEPRPRRDDRPGSNRRDQGDRGPSSRPRRRPPDQYR
jgi:hypothetical protein